MIDRYTKTVLTVIAVTLVMLVLQNLTSRANAESSEGCGRSFVNPCYLATASPLDVRIKK